MDLITRLPSLEDRALAVLHENAERLEQTGTSAQKTAAAALIPAIEAELAARRETKRAELAARRAAKASDAKPRAKRAASKDKGSS
ncbi:MAG TPA: hypothetical protein VE597_08350 [Geminicoccaceae bacterium]|jgi:hypothetical protein|nr:hypothetical protein [Geminicoccaceae bacterium]